MNSLTATELKVLNNVSNVLNSTVDLGTKIDEMIFLLAKSGTPVNAVSASKNFAFTNPVADGETITIGVDVYEFLADAAQSKTDPDNIAVDIESNSTKAARVLTVDTQPTAGDTMTIGTKVYIFVPYGTANYDGEISIGVSLATAKVNIVAAINGTDGFNDPHSLVSASEFATNDCTITALIGGAGGNSIATTETFTAVTNVFAGATLTGGVSCSAANAKTAFIAAVNASGTEAVTASSAAGTTVDITADNGGVAGNNISLAETVANGAWNGSATKLSGGVDGTVGAAGSFMYDSSYLYIAVAANTISGNNWRRISIGSAF